MGDLPLGGYSEFQNERDVMSTPGVFRFGSRLIVGCDFSEVLAQAVFSGREKIRAQAGPGIFSAADCVDALSN